MVRVLFVCLGNICRSPLAEGIFLHQVRMKGLEHKYVADSAGTAGYHIGDDPDHRSMKTARKYGFELDHKGRKFVREDFERFDYIFAMDKNNRLDILSLARDNSSWQEKVYRMRDFDPYPENGDVPDPYYGGIDGFEEVYTMLERSIDQFISEVEK
ncbi:MAG: low molecular weight phosphotyrosine protein phosphatase [Cytophagales bacterium]|nr:low molecular weight phosphotyrosine protein phosphatase [Cytophagales bacterium]